MENDFSAFQAMGYSGRAIIAGFTPKGKLFIGYTITGRSPSSQARILEIDEETGAVRTKPTNLEVLNQGNPALLLYNAIWPQRSGAIIASNGAQTDLIKKTLDTSYAILPEDILDEAFSKPYLVGETGKQIDLTLYEPDAPNNTSRINLLAIGDEIRFHMIKNVNDKAQYISFKVPIKKGHANIISTYNGEDCNPLQPFNGDPLEAKIGTEHIGEIVNSLFESINQGFKKDQNFAVSAAVVLREDDGFKYSIINKHNN